eukprot:CAMPEP_0197666868 /NCGR_PEP_ID=MMETSP1338-20131121/64238_1 /TAXON_ID=43686 ORGANISM="Pelagodinium beii, Strain RCC1491" /NCGR_SAMPLE_ID=MMETSP1338 /ASSEMBLY_ACC=CAM_ASM_000754 /LENGTH=68 /DNA_ID=CAMNT_0043245985 /DNA_START=57 /DNA_END=260 /DNA_ORIENTATION=-
MTAAQVDMRPIALAVAAASPFLMARTIGARVGTHIVTAVIISPRATQILLASASFSSSVFSVAFMASA